MAIRLRMHDDPRRHRCSSCSHGRITTFRDGRVTTTCSEGGINAQIIIGYVEHCSQFLFAHAYAPMRMNEMAFILEVKKGKIKGFRPPRPRDENGREIDDD